MLLLALTFSAYTVMLYINKQKTDFYLAIRKKDLDILAVNIII